MMESIYRSNSGTVLFTKTEKLKWNSEEEDILIELVLADEERLFGPLKDQTSRNKRLEVWRQITHNLNSRCSSEKKDVMSVKKKYFNIKQRAKQKIFEKRRQLGKPEIRLLPVPVTSSGDPVFLQFMQERSGPSGLDTEVSTSATETVQEAITGNSSSHYQPLVSGSHSSEEGFDEVWPDITHEQPVEMRKRLTVKEKIELATLQNIELENERITNEILVQETLKEKLKLEMSVLQHKRDYLELKLNTAYDIVSSESEKQLNMFLNENIDSEFEI